MKYLMNFGSYRIIDGGSAGLVISRKHHFITYHREDRDAWLELVKTTNYRILMEKIDDALREVHPALAKQLG